MLRRRTITPWLFLFALMGLSPSAFAQAQIGGLSDLNLGTWSGLGDLQGLDEHCVRSTPGGRFSIEASGDGPSGAFILSNGAATLPFLVDYDDGGGWTGMTPGQALGGQRGEANNNQFQRCLAGRRPPERLRVRVLAQDLGATGAGSYGGTLTLLVAPD